MREGDQRGEGDGGKYTSYRSMKLEHNRGEKERISRGGTNRHTITVFFEGSSECPGPCYVIMPEVDSALCVQVRIRFTCGKLDLGRRAK